MSKINYALLAGFMLAITTFSPQAEAKDSPRKDDPIHIIFVLDSAGGFFETDVQIERDESAPTLASVQAALEASYVFTMDIKKDNKDKHHDDIEVSFIDTFSGGVKRTTPELMSGKGAIQAHVKNFMPRRGYCAPLETPYTVLNREVRRENGAKTLVVVISAGLDIPLSVCRGQPSDPSIYSEGVKESFKLKSTVSNGDVARIIWVSAYPAIEQAWLPDLMKWAHSGLTPEFMSLEQFIIEFESVLKGL